uniref:Uncharacterized protein n=1 Tax=viral metagenome TaxID=1070528 RepID=A0A6C0CLH6_9ZZZZ
MDLIPTLLYCSFYGSFEEFINYSNTSFSFTTCNSIKKLLQKDNVFNKEVDTLDNMLWRCYCFKLLDWYEKKKCMYAIVKNYRKMKFKMFFDAINNGIYGEETKQRFLNTFMKFQKTQMAFNRIAYLWKYKHATTSVTTDLYLNTIDPTKDSTFVLYQNNKKFNFRISELIHIFGLALYGKFEYHFDVISEPPTNPYNKMKFEIHNLYNIYFHIAFHTKMNMPTIIHLWFKENFNCSLLNLKHQSVLQKLCVQNFVNNLEYTSEKVHEHMNDIIKTNRYLCKWNIDPMFPKKKLLEKLKPCMFYYYMVEFVNCSLDETTHYKIKLSNKLQKMYLQDPTYGTIQKNTFDDKKYSFKFDPTLINKSTFIFGAKTSNTLAKSKKCNRKENRTSKARSAKEVAKNRSHREGASNSKYKRNNCTYEDVERNEAYIEIINLRRQGITVDDTIRMGLGFINNNIQEQDQEYFHITIGSLFE